MAGNTYEINAVTGELEIKSINTDFSQPFLSQDVLRFNTVTGLWSPQALGTVGVQNLIMEEIPSGTINGINKVFTLANNVDANRLMVFLNGIRLQRITTAIRIDQFEHVVNSNTITLGAAPVSTGDGDFLVVTYVKEDV